MQIIFVVIIAKPQYWPHIERINRNNLYVQGN